MYRQRFLLAEIDVHSDCQGSHIVCKVAKLAETRVILKTMHNINPPNTRLLHRSSNLCDVICDVTNTSVDVSWRSKVLYDKHSQNILTHTVPLTSVMKYLQSILIDDVIGVI